MKLIEESIKYLIKVVDGKKLSTKSEHPWRKDAMYIAQHALRVKSYTESIVAAEGIVLNKIDSIALPLSAILHDTAKHIIKEDHAKRSVEMIQDFLNSTNLDKETIQRINEVILDHSNKKERTNDILSNVLKDADLLDEIGMLSVIMTSNWLDRTSAFFFVDLQETLENREMDYINRVEKMLYFEASKEIIAKKCTFIKLVSEQLKLENLGSLDRESYEALVK